MYYTNVGAFSGSKYGQGVGSVVFNNVACDGTENYLSLCSHSGLGSVSYNCRQHSRDAAVVCSSEYLINNYTNYFLHTMNFMTFCTSYQMSSVLIVFLRISIVPFTYTKARNTAQDLFHH